MDLFLAHRKTRPTGRVIAAGLGVEFGVQIRQIPHTLIRWGNAAQWDYDRNQHVVNKAGAISHAGDKLRTFQTLQDAGILTPEFTVSPPLEGDGTWFGRSRRGFGGRDIAIYAQGTSAYGYGQHDFFTRYIPNDREYRLHVVGDEVVRLQRKYPERPELDSQQGMVKNHKNGYVFKAPQKRLNHDRYEQAVAAVKALGLDFGAVDTIVDGSGTMYVLEVNTAPGCSPRTAQAYIDALKTYL
jgi:hypothetical protein